MRCAYAVFSHTSRHDPPRRNRDCLLSLKIGSLLPIRLVRQSTQRPGAAHKIHGSEDHLSRLLRLREKR